MHNALQYCLPNDQLCEAINKTPNINCSQHVCCNHTHTHTHTPSVPRPLPPIVIPSLCSSIFPPTDCKISSLHCHTQQLLVGLCSGKILVLDALTFSHLSSLTCHRGPVQALFTLSPPPPSSSDTSSHYSSPHWTSAKKKSSRNSFPDRSSLGSMSLPNHF